MSCCLPDIHVNISEQNKNLLGPTLNSPFPLTIKSLYLCHSFRKWHTKVTLYSVLNLKFYSTPLAIPADSILILNFSYGHNLHGSCPSPRPHIVSHDYLKGLLALSFFLFFFSFFLGPEAQFSERAPGQSWVPRAQTTQSQFQLS